MGILSIAVRSLKLRRHRSTVPTGLIPLEQVHRAVVFLDSEDGGCEEAKEEIIRFFADNGIELTLLCPRKWEISWWGGLKKVKGEKVKKVKKVKKLSDEDLFISLAGESNKTAEYLARCSKAKCKVGRFNLSDGLFDIIVTNSDDMLPKLVDVFRTMKDILIKIQ